MGCKSMRVGLSMGVGTRRLHGVEGISGLWASRWVLLGSCYEKEMDASMVYSSSMSILRDENSAGVASAVRGAIACMAFTAASTFPHV